MLFSNVALVAVVLVVRGYAAPADQIANTDAASGQLDLFEYPAVEGGSIDEIEIPQLANFTLLYKNGTHVYDIPSGGVDISPELYEQISGRKPEVLEKRYCDNPCDCGTHRTWNLGSANWNKFLGAYKVMSSPECGPGTITKTFTKSSSYQVSGSIDPSLGLKLDQIFLEKLGFKVGFSYTWGTAVATGYTATCSEEHPCIAVFRPWVGVVKGRAAWTDLSNSGNKLCASGYAGNIEIHLPIVRDCDNDTCGADGVWDHCYYVGALAKALCPVLGPTPKAVCPASIYP